MSRTPEKTLIIISHARHRFSRSTVNSRDSLLTLAERAWSSLFRLPLGQLCNTMIPKRKVWIHSSGKRLWDTIRRTWGLNLEGWRVLRSKGYQNLSQKEWKMEENRQSGVSRREVWKWLNLKSSYHFIYSLAHCRSCVQLWTNDVLWMWVHTIHIFMPQEAKAPERHSFFTGWGTEEDWVNAIVQWQKEDNDQWFSKVFLPGIPHLKLAVSEQCLNWNADEIWQTQTSPVISPLCLSDCCQRLSGKPLLRSMAIFQRHKNECFAEAVSFSHSFSVLCCILRLNRIFSLLMKYVINYYHPQSFLLWSLLSLLAFF